MIFIVALIILVVIVALIVAGIADSNRYRLDDPDYARKKKEKAREWERRQTRESSRRRAWKK